MRRNIEWVLCLIAAMVIVLVVDHVLPIPLSAYGIYPGKLQTLPSIFIAPFLHVSWTHLANNIVIFLVLSLLALVQNPHTYFKSSFVIIVISGILVWLFARPANHVGASGWIFGLWSLVIVRACLSRRLLNILIAIFVIVFYGGMFYGLLPLSDRVSFESHFFGTIAGLLAALGERKKR